MNRLLNTTEDAQKVWDNGKVVGDSVPSDYNKARQYYQKYLETHEPLKLPLLPIQRLSVAAATAMKYSAIWDDMGLGKTAQALAKDVLGGHETTVIFCPNNVKKVWVQEIEKFTKFRSRDIFVGKGKDLISLPDMAARKYRFIIFNYESLVVAAKYPHITPSVFKEATHHILDEAHAFRNAETTRFEAYIYHLKHSRPDAVTMLSGTPLDRCMNELWPYLAILDLNPNKKDHPLFRYYPKLSNFSDRYANASRSGDRLHWKGYQQRTLFEIKNLMGPKCIQRKIHEVMELPKLHKRDIVIPSHLFEEDMEKTKKQLGAAFNRIHSKTKLLDALNRGTLEDCGDKAIRAVQAIRMSLAKQKTPWSTDMAIKYLSYAGPTIIFSEFKEPLKIIEENLRKVGYNPTMVNGDMKMVERDYHITNFKRGEHEFLLATYGVLSEGENLQQSNAIVFNDLSWQPLVIKQATRRIWRIGQEKECHVVQMLCTADEFVLNIVTNKQKMIEKFEQFLVEIKEENGYV